MKIAIIEDDKDDMKWINTLFKKCADNSNHTLYIDYYSSGKQFLDNLSYKKYQLIITDIFMDDMDGIETAKCVQNIDEDVLIVFLTTSEDEIWRAVKTHGCFDYVQKQSFDKKRLEKLLNDVYKKLKVQDESLIFLNGKQEVKLRLKNIQYITANDKYTVINQKSQINKYRTTFSNICELLEKNKNFILCNRGIMLNMDFIMKTDGDTFLMKDKTKHPIRRKGRKEIIETFHNYQFQKLDNQEIPV